MSCGRQLRSQVSHLYRPLDCQRSACCKDDSQPQRGLERLVGEASMIAHRQAETTRESASEKNTTVVYSPALRRKVDRICQNQCLCFHAPGWVEVKANRSRDVDEREEDGVRPEYLLARRIPMWRSTGSSRHRVGVRKERFGCMRTGA